MECYGFPILFFILIASAVAFFWASAAHLRKGSKKKLPQFIFGFLAFSFLSVMVYYFWGEALQPEKDLCAIIEPVPEIESVVSSPLAYKGNFLQRKLQCDNLKPNQGKSMNDKDRLKAFQWTVDTGLEPEEVRGFYHNHKNLNGWRAVGDGRGVLHFKKGPAWLVVSYVGLNGPKESKTRVVYSYSPNRD